MIAVFVIFLTELVSNTASAALLVPLFVGVAAEFGLPTLEFSHTRAQLFYLRAKSRVLVLSDSRQCEKGDK